MNQLPFPIRLPNLTQRQLMNFKLLLRTILLVLILLLLVIIDRKASCRERVYVLV